MAVITTTAEYPAKLSIISKLTFPLAVFQESQL